ncbi:MAG: type IV pilin N-terminal domain-containing protein [Methanoregula sp.]|nr:type IV pilin N-terminal domain-containing protein [Methanoregula sp.]
MMCTQGKSRDDAVSPVVGVMLMLVVTIIIAAVVSAFAGGMAKTTDKAPTVSMECRIANGGTWGSSEFDCAVLGTSDAVLTKDLKIITSWTARDGTKGGGTVTGPNNTFPNTRNAGGSYHSPLGFGPGVGNTTSTGSYTPDQSYGNYSLVAGTHMHNVPYGYIPTYGGYGVSIDKRYNYTFGTTYRAGDVDALQAILGNNWDKLRQGDLVKLRMFHIPSGKVIYEKDVTVGGQ